MLVFTKAPFTSGDFTTLGGTHGMILVVSVSCNFLCRARVVRAIDTHRRINHAGVFILFYLVWGASTWL